MAVKLASVIRARQREIYDGRNLNVYNDYKTGKYTYHDLSIKYGVKRSRIGQILAKIEHDQESQTN